MKLKNIISVLVVAAFVITGCGKKQVQEETEGQTFGAAITQNRQIRTATASAPMNALPNYWNLIVENYLNQLYGQNPNVGMVVFAGGGFVTSNVYSGAAGQALYMKDYLNQFHWVSGNVTKLPVITTFPLSPLFAAYGLYPYAAASTAMCAGQPNATAEASVVVLGLAQRSVPWAMVGVALAAQRSGSTYQMAAEICDSYSGCQFAQTGLQTIPPSLQGKFPACDALLASAIGAVKGSSKK